MAAPETTLDPRYSSPDAPATEFVEGEAVRVRDDARLRELADAWVEKYGEAWRHEVGDGGFRHTLGDEHGTVLVFEVAPTTAFGFGKGERFSQTRWRF